MCIAVSAMVVDGIAERLNIQRLASFFGEERSQSTNTTSRIQYNLYRKERERKHTTVYILVNLVSHNFNKTSLSRIFNAANQHFIEIIRDPKYSDRSHLHRRRSIRTYSTLAIGARESTSVVDRFNRSHLHYTS